MVLENCTGYWDGRSLAQGHDPASTASETELESMSSWCKLAMNVPNYVATQMEVTQKEDFW